MNYQEHKKNLLSFLSEFKSNNINKIIELITNNENVPSELYDSLPEWLVHGLNVHNNNLSVMQISGNVLFTEIKDGKLCFFNKENTLISSYNLESV